MLGEASSVQGYNPQSFSLSPLEGKARPEECEDNSSPSEKLLIGSLPHEYVEEQKKEGKLNAINLRMNGAECNDLRDRLKSGEISFEIPQDSTHTSENGFPLTVKLSLSESSGPTSYLCCKDSKEKIYVTVTDNSGHSITNKIVSGFSTNQGEKDYYVLDYGEKRLMEYAVGSDNKVASSTVQVTNKQYDGYTHLERASHDQGFYGTFNAIGTDGKECPTVCMEYSIKDWNDPLYSCGKLVRSLVGLVTNGSQNPGLKPSSMIRLVISVGFGFAFVQAGDRAAASAQAAAGYAQVSFTGTNAGDPAVESAKMAGLVVGLATALTCGSIKDATGVESEFVDDKKETKALTTRMVLLEALGFQLVPGTVMSLVAIVTDQVANNGQGINPWKMIIDSTVTQFFINGLLGSGIQAKMIQAGYHPLLAWFGYFTVRALPFRICNNLLQHVTSQLFLGCSEGTSNPAGFNITNNGTTAYNLTGSGTTPYLFTENPNHNFTANGTVSTIAGPESSSCSWLPSWEDSVPVLIAQYVNEGILSGFNVSTYLAGAFKKTDGSEEQAVSYCKDHDIPINPLNRMRIGLQKWVDSTCNSVKKSIANFACTPFGGAALGLSDSKFLSLRAQREQIMTEPKSSPNPISEREISPLNI